MSNWNHGPGRQEDQEIKPPYSRIFVVCSRELDSQDLEDAFGEYGEIETIYIPKDRNTGVRRGVAYIKYAKTSSAAAAIQDKHLKTIGSSNKPIKVMIANSRNDKNDTAADQCDRLFIKVSKSASDDDIRDKFSKFGTVDSVYVLKDRNTSENRGLAYVQFKSFLDAAKAFEQCERHYKPVFAAPKSELKRERDDRDYNYDQHNYAVSRKYNDYYNAGGQMPLPRDNVSSLIKTPSQNYKTICVTCTPAVGKAHIETLFNVVPGMVQFDYSIDSYSGFGRAMVAYEDEKAAAHAVDRLNNFEFPSGQIVTVKPDNPLSKVASDLTTMVNSFKNAVDSGSPDLVQLAEAIAQASSLIKVATSGRMDNSSDNMRQDSDFCNVALPSAQPFAHPNAKTEQRCFIVCKPQPPHIQVLKDVFSRFGDLIEITTFPNKTYVFAKYASAKSAQDAIATLHGAIVCGVKLKVLEADDKPNRDDDNNRRDSMDHEDSSNKRMRLDKD